jgi:uncharacterized membrane protein
MYLFTIKCYKSLRKEENMNEYLPLIAISFTIIIQLVGVGISIGTIKSNYKLLENRINNLKEHMKESIDRLEKKQDKHNNVIERVCLVEASSKQAHKRIDRIDRLDKNDSVA